MGRLPTGPAATWRSRAVRGWPACLLTLLTLAFLWDQWWAGRTFAMRDTICDFVPHLRFAAAAYRAGHLPLWNAFTGFGKPFLADVQTASLYPPHLLFLVLPAGWALSVSWTFHFLVSALGCYALMRHWRLGVPASLLAAVSFTFSTWMVAWMEFVSGFDTAVWGPVTLLALDQVIGLCQASRSWRDAARPTFFWVAVLALVAAVQYLAGHPEILLETALLAAFYTVARLGCFRRIAAAGRCLVALGAAGWLAALMISPQLLPALEFIGRSERSGDFDPGLDLASVHPGHYLSLLLPFVDGRPGYPRMYWGRTLFEFYIGTCYVGLLPLALIPFACWRLTRGRDPARPHRFLGLFFMAVAALALLLAAGGYTPLYLFAHEHVPGFNHFRWPGKFLYVLLYPICFLAALGLDTLLRIRPGLTHRQRIGIALATLGAAGIFGGLWLHGRDSAQFVGFLAGARFPATPENVAGVVRDLGQAFVFAAGAAATLCWIVFFRPRETFVGAVVSVGVWANLYVVDRQIQPTMPRSVYATPLPPLAQAGTRGDLRILSSYAGAQQWLYGTGTPDLYRWAASAGVGDLFLPLRAYQLWQGGMKLDDYLQAMTLLSNPSPEVAGRFADLFSIGFVGTGQPVEAILWQRGDRTIDIVARPSALPRIRLVSRWQSVGSLEEAYRVLLSDSFVPANDAVVENGEPGPFSVPADAPGTVDRVTDLANELSVDTASPVAALLIVGDAWYPGWRAFVDGRPTPLWRANALFRGVPLPAGRHHVVLRYWPTGLTLALGLSLSTGAALTAILALAARGGFRSRKPGPR